MSKGTDYQVIIWIIVMGLWGLGKFIAGLRSRSAEKHSPQPQNGRPPSPPPTHRKTHGPIMQNLMELIEQQARLANAPRNITPETQPPPPSPPRRKNKPPKTSMFTNIDQGYSTAPSIPTTSQFAALSNTMQSTASAMRMPAVKIPTGTGSPTSTNPLHPKWKTKNDLKRAMVASIILQRPQY